MPEGGTQGPSTSIFGRGLDAGIAFSGLRSAQWRKRHNTKLVNIGSPRGSCKTACRLNFGLALDGAIRSWRPTIFQIKSQFPHLGRPKSGAKMPEGGTQGPSTSIFGGGLDAGIAFSGLRSVQWRKRHNIYLPNIGSPRGSCKTARRLNFGWALDGAIGSWGPKRFQIKSQFLHLGRPKSGANMPEGGLQNPSDVNFLARPRCRNFNFWVEERAMAQTLEYIST